MNYGEEFIKLHNKELSSFKKVITDRIAKDYTSPFLNDNLYNHYFRFLDQLIKKIEKNLSDEGVYYIVLEHCYNLIIEENFKFDRTKNIINIHFKNYFESHPENFNKIEFSYFLKIFSKYYILKYYLNFIISNKQTLFDYIDNKDIKEFFKIKYIKNDLNQLQEHPSKIVKTNSTEETNKDNYIQNNGSFQNPFSKDEKFIILHYLFEHERYQEPKLSSYEITLLLKITTDCFKGYNPKTKRDTSYDKFHKGFGHYKVSNRIKSDKLATLISKLKKINNGKFVLFLESKLLDYEFYNSKTQG